jgi:hypothetical protein
VALPSIKVSIFKYNQFFRTLRPKNDGIELHNEPRLMRLPFGPESFEHRVLYMCIDALGGARTTSESPPRQRQGKEDTEDGVEKQGIK